MDRRKDSTVLANLQSWWATQYEEERAQRWTIWKDPVLAKAVADFISPLDYTLLVACGIGHAATAINQFTKNIMWAGVDFVQQALDENKVCGFKTCHDLSHLPWPYANKHFDVVVCSEILEAVPDPLEVMLECARISTKVVFFTFPVGSSLRSTVNRNEFTEDSVRRLLEKYINIVPGPCELQVSKHRNGDVLLVRTSQWSK